MLTDLRQPELTQVQELNLWEESCAGTVTELMGGRLRFDDRLQAATAHPGTVTELMGARLRFDDRL